MSRVDFFGNYSFPSGDETIPGFSDISLRRASIPLTGDASAINGNSSETPSTKPLNSPTSSKSSRRNTRVMSPNFYGVTTQDTTAFLDGEGDHRLDQDDPFSNARILGQGSEGSVYLVRGFLNDSSEAIPMAVKVFHQEKSGESNKPNWQAILTEHHVTSSDFNLLKLYDSENVSLLGKKITNNHPNFIVMPTFDITLDKLVDFAKERASAVDKITWSGIITHMMSDILKALEHMHTFPHANGVGVAHRDLKLSNMALKTSGSNDYIRHFVLYDLSTAEPLNDMTARFAGTTSYMHPNCFIEGHSTATAANDFYQLGAAMLEMFDKADAIKPPKKLDIFRMTEWKTAQYDSERTPYEATKTKQRESLRKETTSRNDMARTSIRVRSGLFQVNSHRSLPNQPIILAKDTTAYPSLTLQLKQYDTAADKLLCIAKHLTRCFEQPNIDELIAAVGDIQQSLLSDHPDLSERIDSFYQEAIQHQGNECYSTEPAVLSFNCSQQASPICTPRRFL